MHLLLAMLAPFFWGTTAAATHLGFGDWPPLALAVLRALPAGLILLVLMPRLPAPGQWRPLILNAIVNVVLFFPLVFLVALNLPATLAAVGMSATPVCALVIQGLLERRVPNVKQGTIAVLIVAAAWGLFRPESLPNGIGIVSMIAAMAVMVGGSHYSKRIMERIPWQTVVVWQLILGGTMLIPWAALQWWMGDALYATAWEASGTRILTGLWLVGPNTVLAYLFFVWTLTKVSVTQFSFASIANPIAGILAGVLLVHESFTLAQYGLMGVMIAGSLSAQLVKEPNDSTRLRSTPMTVSSPNGP